MIHVFKFYGFPEDHSNRIYKYFILYSKTVYTKQSRQSHNTHTDMSKWLFVQFKLQCYVKLFAWFNMYAHVPQSVVLTLRLNITQVEDLRILLGIGKLYQE